MRSSSASSRPCRCASHPAPAGSTASRPTCWAACRGASTARARWARRCRSASSSRSAWSTRSSRCRPPRSRAPPSPGRVPSGQPMTPRFKVDDGAKYESGGGGLTCTMDDYLRFAVDAGQRRRAPGQAPDRQADPGLHDRRPHRHAAGPSAGPGLRPGLRGPDHGRRGGAAGLGRRIWLGRQCRHAVLDRSQGTS